jgi:carbonic anhydrase
MPFPGMYASGRESEDRRSDASQGDVSVDDSVYCTELMGGEEAGDEAKARDEDLTAVKRKTKRWRSARFMNVGKMNLWRAGSHHSIGQKQREGMSHVPFPSAGGSQDEDVASRENKKIDDEMSAASNVEVPDDMSIGASSSVASSKISLGRGSVGGDYASFACADASVASFRVRDAESIFDGSRMIPGLGTDELNPESFNVSQSFFRSDEVSVAEFSVHGSSVLEESYPIPDRFSDARSETSLSSSDRSGLVATYVRRHRRGAEPSRDGANFGSPFTYANMSVEVEDRSFANDESASVATEMLQLEVEKMRGRVLNEQEQAQCFPITVSSTDNTYGKDSVTLKKPTKTEGGFNRTSACLRYIGHLLALTALIAGLSIIIAILYGTGVINFDVEQTKADIELAVCSRVGFCGTYTPSSAIGDEVPISPTVGPTMPYQGECGWGAMHKEKARECGATNPSWKANCCPGLVCEEKICIDPSYRSEEAKTASPTLRPKTAMPTSLPTETGEPTSSPSANIWRSESTKQLTERNVTRPPGHFNYDPADDEYGPTAWSKRSYTAYTSATLNGDEVLFPHEEWQELPNEEIEGLAIIPAEEAADEFKFWARHAWSIKAARKATILDNVCNSTEYHGAGKEGRARQSPIDIYVRSGIVHKEADVTGKNISYVEPMCYEHHEIRIKPGQFPLSSTKIEKQILPSKLRLVYPDPEFEADGVTLSDDSKLPRADFPHDWGGDMEFLKLDVKIPSEHRLEGKEYAAEVQLYHLHHLRKKAPVISILVDLHPDDKENGHFQLALDEWQKVWEKDYLECELRRRRERRLEAGVIDNMMDWLGVASGVDREYSSWLDEPAEEDVRFHRSLRAARRAQQADAFWNPYDPEILPSIHFYGYSGSLTEPPCTEFVEWRIIDTPMLISQRQLFQLKTLLFRHVHVESGCEYTSNHHMGSNARRPLQPLNQRIVYRCSCRDFLSDEERDMRLASANLTESSATFTPRCSKKEFRSSETLKPWLY